MGEGRNFEPGRLFGRLMSLLLLASTVALSGCDGDTLYDAVPAAWAYEGFHSTAETILSAEAA